LPFDTSCLSNQPNSILTVFPVECQFEDRLKSIKKEEFKRGEVPLLISLSFSFEGGKIKGVR